MSIETPSVLLIYTGGTIGMIENSETGALENFNFDHLLKHVPELKRFNYRISSYQFDPHVLPPYEIRGTFKRPGNVYLRKR